MSDSQPTVPPVAVAAPMRDPDPGLVTVTHVVYALHAVSLVVGAFGAATVVGSFLFGWLALRDRRALPVG